MTPIRAAKLVTLLGTTLGISLASGLASAQYGAPNSSAPSAPVSLDPAGEGNQIPAAPAAPSQPARSNDPVVVTVGPDGKITSASTGGGSAAPDYGNFHYGDGMPDGGDTSTAEVHGGPVPELHVVRRGDTLWDICWYYFNDPWQWPKIWSYNAQITNPHWIYPGDLVRLLPRGVFAQAAPTDPEKGNDVGKPPIAPPPPARKTEVGIKQIAFVEKDDLDRSITIDGAVDEKVLLGQGDSVYLSYPDDKVPEVGKRYSIYEVGTSVKSKGKNIGSYVRILGAVEVVSVKQDKRARGIIVEANHEIERGLKVGTLLRTYKNVPNVAPKADVQGQIVAMLAKDELIGQGEIVIMDLGEDSGVEVGNRLFVVRRGDGVPKTMDPEIGLDDRRFPARALGEVVVVEVGKGIAIGLVTLAVQELGVGDLVMMQQAK